MWTDLVGQDEAKQLLIAASQDERQMTHSWLIVGPPGSGRSNMAYAFASSLLGADAHSRVLVAARTHPDLLTVNTEAVTISIDQVRDLVNSAALSPSIARWRVIVIEDADRMTERTSNVLLKALEEPPNSTVWILCAPSEADLLPTIRSRVRTVRLKTPSVDEVAALIEARDGVSPQLARKTAREAQSHIGMARRLATSEDARARRDRVIELVLSGNSGYRMAEVAAEVLKLAEEDAKIFTDEREQAGRAKLLKSLGLAESDPVPNEFKATFKQLADEQKKGGYPQHSGRAGSHLC